MSKEALLLQYREDDSAENYDWLNIFSDMAGFDGLKKQRQISRDHGKVGKQELIEEFEKSFRESTQESIHLQEIIDNKENKVDHGRPNIQEILSKEYRRSSRDGSSEYSSNERGLETPKRRPVPRVSSTSLKTPKEAHRQNSLLETPSIIQQILERYTINERLGKGAFATVFRATNKRTNKSIAIKQVLLEADHDTEALMSEITLLKSLHHRNIVKYHGFVQRARVLHIFLEYCAGGLLRERCKAWHRSGTNSETATRPYLRQVLSGLTYLHGEHVVHRDIKAANILVTGDGVVKLADFGVLTKVSVQTVVQGTAGTPYWMAPEAIRLEKTTTASDIWLLGATVVELLTGDPPYAKLNPMAAMHAIVTEASPPLPQGMSEAAKDFLRCCFQKNITKRATARALGSHYWLGVGRYAEEEEEEDDWERDFEGGFEKLRLNDRRQRSGIDRKKSDFGKLRG